MVLRQEGNYQDSWRVHGTHTPKEKKKQRKKEDDSGEGGTAKWREADKEDRQRKVSRERTTWASNRLDNWSRSVHSPGPEIR